MDRIIAAKVFISIVQHSSLTGAADSLDMSRSMVTRYLNTMEKWAGARLLHRSTRSISLSPAGEKMLIQCERLQSIADEVNIDSQNTADSLSGPLRIACSLSFSQDVLMPLFQSFLKDNPLVSVDLHISNLAVNLIKERIDLAIRITNDLDPNLIARQLGQCHSVICATPGYLQQHKSITHLTDLSNHNCLTYSRFGKSLWRFSHCDEELSVPVSGNFTADDPSVILQGALQGLGIALQPKYAANAYIKKGLLVPILPQYTPQKLGIYGLYSSRQHMSNTLRTMLDLLIVQLRMLSG
ncbi:MAG: LysR family transcriptional regulator [Oceanospirillaceae bacterium]